MLICDLMVILNLNFHENDDSLFTRRKWFIYCIFFINLNQSWPLKANATGFGKSRKEVQSAISGWFRPFKVPWNTWVCEATSFSVPLSYSSPIWIGNVTFSTFSSMSLKLFHMVKCLYFSSNLLSISFASAEVISLCVF